MGRKSILGLSLLSALLVCALAAQGASAAWQTATKTTAFTCVKNGGVRDFAAGDSHCSKAKVTPETGEFGHVEIAPNGGHTKTVTTNETTGGAVEPAVLTSSLLGATVKITCKKVANAGGEAGENANWLENVQTVEGAVTKHDVAGHLSIAFTECTQEGQGTKCKVKEPLVIGTNVTAQEEPATENMAYLFSAETGKPYTVISFEGTCLIASTETKGAIRGTTEGATLKFEAKDEELTCFGNPATLTAKLTTKMAGVGGNPVATTTVTK
jgi:hypothetical protein